MTRTAVSTPDAPVAVGPYSQGIAAGGFLFCAGQLGLAPATGQLVEGGVVAETEQALANLRAVLGAAGCTFGDLVKTTIFLADINEYGAVNETYATFMADPPPARSTFAVGELPRGARIEIEAIALLPER
jgi:2-iminobutanoate/2-iminopropanoate deaminase